VKERDRTCEAETGEAKVWHSFHIHYFDFRCKVCTTQNYLLCLSSVRVDYRQLVAPREILLQVLFVRSSALSCLPSMTLAKCVNKLNLSLLSEPR